MLPIQIGPSGAFRGPGRCFIHMKTQHMAAPAPAAPRRGGRCGRRVLRFHMYEAPPGPPGGPRKARFEAEALVSNPAQRRDLVVGFRMVTVV
jgi:hypothetical protein